MSSPFPRHALRVWPSLLLLAGALAAHADLGPGRAVVPLTVNGVASGDVAVLFEGGDVLVRVAALDAAGLHGFGGHRRAVDGEELVSLSSLAPDVTWRFDETELSLALTAAPTLLPRQSRNLSRGRPAGIVYTHDPSAFLNYSVTRDSAGGTTGFSELGWSLGRALLYSAATRQRDGRLVRGLTNLTVDDTERMVRWVVGDTLATGGDLGGNAFLAGLSVSRNFELDPYFYRYPGLSVSGAVTAPTRADVYVNGQLVRQETLAPGTFDLSDIPLFSGAGETRVVLRDPFGGQRVLASPFYLSTALLAKGLSEYSYNVGVLREDLAADSARYGAPVFFGVHRYGLTDRLTVGARLEAGERLASAGISAATSFPLGALEASLAGSRAGGSRGTAAALRYAVSTPVLGLGAYVRLASDRYATVSLPAAGDRVIRELGGSVGVNLGRGGSLTLQYAAQRWRDSGSSRAFSAWYTTRLFDDVSFLLSAGRSRTPDGTRDTRVSASLSMFLGGTTTASASWQRDDAGSREYAQIQRSLPLGEGLGYRLQASAVPGSEAVNGLAQYNGPFGAYEAGVSASGGIGSGYATASGGIVAIGGSLFATRPVQQAFALIRVPGVDGVRGYASNQEIGRTNRAGQLLVPNLVPYYGNALAISDLDVPLDYEIGRTKALVAPPFRGGSVVAFPVHRVRAFTGSIRVSFAGTEVVPAYGSLSLTVAGRSYESPIGGTGEFFLENVPAGAHPARVLYLGVPCRFTMSFPESTEPVVSLGRLSCTTAAPLPAGAVPAARPRLKAATAPLPAASSSPARSSAGVSRAPAHGRAPGRDAVVTGVEAARATGAAGSGHWGVQVAAYRQSGAAEEAAARLAATFGTTGCVLEAELGHEGIWYRVVLGTFGSAAEARWFERRNAPRFPEGIGYVRRYDASAGKPAPVSPSAAATTPVARPMVVQKPVAAPMVAKPASASLLRSADWAGREPIYVVHVASFRERAKADAVATSFAALLGTTARAVEVDLGDRGTWYRVVLGAFASGAEASRFRAAVAPKVDGAIGSVYRLEGPSEHPS